MDKRRMREAAVKQVGDVAHDLPEDQVRAVGKKEKRTVRLVVRLDLDEHRRLSRYCADRHLPVSTAVRSLVMEAIRKA